MVVTYSTPAVSPMMASTFFATASVLSSDDASGSWMFAKK